MMGFHGKRTGWESGCRCRDCWAWANRELGVPMPSEAVRASIAAKDAVLRRSPKPDPDATRRLKHLEECARPRTVPIHNVGLRKI